MKVYKAPQQIMETEGHVIFLAGTIDMGKSENWQNETIQFFKNKVCTILNPRRDEWDSSWGQSANNKQFSRQVNWELDGMERAGIIIMNFLAGSQSPVTMLELGLNASNGKLKVCCPETFWRSGNIHIVCKGYSIPLYNEMKSLLNDIQL